MTQKEDEAKCAFRRYATLEISWSRRNRQYIAVLVYAGLNEIPKRRVVSAFE